MFREQETINKILNNEALTVPERQHCAWGNVGTFIEEIECGTGRWTAYVTTIFKINNDYYAIDWQRGLVENIENEYMNNPYPVIRKEKIVTTTKVYYERKE